MWRTAVPDAGLVERARRLYHFARNASHECVDIFALRCERGADIVRMLDLGGDAARAVRDLDEVLAIMRQDAGTKLDGDVFLALEEYLPRYLATPAGRDVTAVAA